ncbi:hypothetical protein KC361_g8940 [Hortaea werneckii]|nr:hypothetical protein KC361_g8940 [Hortaea werneckii]
MKVTSTTFSFGTNSVSREAFWTRFRAYLTFVPTNVAHCTYTYFFILPSSNVLTFLMTHVASAARLWPRTNWGNETILNATIDAIRSSAETGLTTIAFNQAPTWAAAGKQDTAVNPAWTPWRETLCHMISSVNWPLYASAEEQMEIRHNFTFNHMQRWRDASPGAGSYLSESDRLEPNFQWAFYGSYYPKLLELKRKFDPKNVFWAATAVGSKFF